jgi:hypothetical protein
MGQRLRGLFQAAGFGHVEAFADYVSYGTPDRVSTFAADRAAECRDRELHAAVTRYGIASTEELLDLAVAWEKWGDDPTAFLPSRGVGCRPGAKNTGGGQTRGSGDSATLRLYQLRRDQDLHEGSPWSSIAARSIHRGEPTSRAEL